MHRAVHLGIAVDLDFQGLVVPVVHDADGLRLRALAAAIRDVAARARARKLTPDDLAGGTFTITNPGASGTWISFPVINRPQVGILATDGVVEAGRRRRRRPACASRRSATSACRSTTARSTARTRARSSRRVQEIVETRDWLTRAVTVSCAGFSTSVGLQSGGAVTGSQRAGVPPGICTV